MQISLGEWVLGRSLFQGILSFGRIRDFEEWPQNDLRERRLPSPGPSGGSLEMGAWPQGCVIGPLEDRPLWEPVKIMQNSWCQPGKQHSFSGGVMGQRHAHRSGTLCSDAC